MTPKTGVVTSTRSSQVQSPIGHEPQAMEVAPGGEGPALSLSLKQAQWLGLLRRKSALFQD